MAERNEQENYVLINEYDEIIEQDGYFTGIARVESPSGEGRFRIEVSGQLDSIQEFAANAKILILHLEDADVDSFDAIVQERENQIAERRRNELHMLLDAAHERVDEASPAELSDPDFLCNLILQAPVVFERGEPEFNPELDREILIAIEDEIVSETPLVVRFKIDPAVAQGHKDIYGPVVDRVKEVQGGITVGSGNPDLRLYRGGKWKDGSATNSGTESVAGKDGAGNWRMHVYGQTDATYEVNGDWLLFFDDIG